MEKAISKLENEFPDKILTGINACLKSRDSVSATILICCAIDLLSKYYSGDVEQNGNKKRFIQFFEEYFSHYQKHEDFYKFVRCGLVHSFNLDRKYILLNSNAMWAKKLNMKISPKHKMSIINPWQLRTDLRKAWKQFTEDLKKDKALRVKIRKVYKQYPLEGQTMKIAKFRYMETLNIKTHNNLFQRTAKSRGR